MEDRLLKLLDTEQLSSAKFADAIGVQRSSVSHILSGRNKPSFDFLQKTLKAFPILSAEWLILGEGNMYKGAVGPVSGSLFDQPQRERISEPAETASGQDKSEGEPADLSAAEASVSVTDDRHPEKSVSEEVKTGPGILIQEAEGKSGEKFSGRSKVGNDGKTIVRVIVFYSDKTFESFEIAD